jgi:hypothetical protein
MGFAEYFKQWVGQEFAIFEDETNKESNEIDELITLINLEIGNDPLQEADVRRSNDTIQKVLDKIDVEKIENKDEDVIKVAKALSRGEKSDFVEKFLESEKKRLPGILKEKRAFNTVDNFKKFIQIKSIEAKIQSNVWKIYSMFDYLRTLPEKDESASILDSFKETGFFIKVDPNQKGNRFKITKLGEPDGLKNNQAKVIFNNGDDKIYTKEDILKFIEADPATKAKADKIKANLNRDSIKAVVKLAEGIITNELISAIEIDIDQIESIPNTEEGREYLDVNWKPLIDALGLGKTLKAPIEKKEKEIEKTERIPVKRKSIIKNRLFSALNGALLPPIQNGEVVTPGGDYFRLFKKIEGQNKPWLDLSINEHFNGEKTAISQFNQGARVKESAAEEDQMAYLGAIEIWVIKYLESEVDGSLNDRDTQSAVAKVKNIALEKQKEIKNYYLSRDFNMSNTRGLQLKPDLTLPLYVKVKLAVSEADRIKESPLHNVIKGIGQLTTGLFAGIPDNGDAAVAKKNAEQNKAVFNGILSFFTAGAYAVGKQQGRDFEKKVDKVTNKLGLGNVGLTPYKDGEGPQFFKTADGASKSNESIETNLKEDAVMAVSPEGTGGTPGQVFQTPDMLPSDMDPLSLAGPGKKKKGAKKDKIVIGTKVANFSDFLKGK